MDKDNDAYWQTDGDVDWQTDADRFYEEARDAALDQKPDEYFIEQERKLRDALEAHRRVQQGYPCDEMDAAKPLVWFGLAIVIIGAGYGLYRALWHLVPIYPEAWLGLLLSVPVAVLATALTWHNFREFKDWKGGAVVALCVWALAIRCLVTIGGK